MFSVFSIYLICSLCVFNVHYMFSLSFIFFHFDVTPGILMLFLMFVTNTRHVVTEFGKNLFLACVPGLVML